MVSWSCAASIDHEPATGRVASVARHDLSVLEMTLVSAERRLIVAYAALLALFDLSVLLPGNPVSNTGEFIVAVGVQALVVWRLWEGSSLSWLLAMFFAAGYIVTIVLMQPKVEVGVILTFVLSVAQVLTLWM